MNLPKPQNPLDWLTQLWNILLGRKIDSELDSWLLGPIGKAGEFQEDFVRRLADESQYIGPRPDRNLGLLDVSDLKDLDIHPSVLDFYTNTGSYRLEVVARWRKGFSFLGRLGSRLFTKRIMQFQLPDSKTGSRKSFLSQIQKFFKEGDGTSCSLWSRSDEHSAEMIFYGLYSTCFLPDGRRAVKTVFPLPEGNATVIFEISVTPAGHLELSSRGCKNGDPGFYFIVEDAKGCQWKHFLRFFKQKILVYPDSDVTLKAEHRFSFFNQEFYRIDYFIHQ